VLPSESGCTDTPRDVLLVGDYGSADSAAYNSITIPLSNTNRKS